VRCASVSPLPQTEIGLDRLEENVLSNVKHINKDDCFSSAEIRVCFIRRSKTICQYSIRFLNLSGTEWKCEVRKRIALTAN
jgi:hypothetical protein